MSNEIEVEIGVGARPGEYPVQVVRAASGGEPRGVLQLDVAGLLRRRDWLENAVLASAARARGGAVPAAEQPLREAGQELFEGLFTGTVGETYRASLAVARERGVKLRVVLHLNAPELAALPWEAMWDPELQAYLCRKEPLVRHVPAPYTPDPLPVTPPLRILGLVASPRGLPALDVEREQQHLDEALDAAQANGRVVLEWLTTASWDSLQDRLLNAQWHVLHFIGHGDYDAATDQGRVALVDDRDGRADWVEAGRLVDLLNEADPTPRLVVLNSCSSGQAGTRDELSGTAAALVHGGISAVAAMQFRISDPAAVAFPRGFYRALAAGKGVDAAISSGRIAILGQGDSLEWVTPVLYVRGDSAQLFSLTPAPPAAHPGPAPTPPEPAALSQPQTESPQTRAPHPTEDPRYQQAENAYLAGNWDKAISLFEQVSADYPGADLPGLVQARKRRDLAVWWAQADKAHERRDWAAAVASLERVVAHDPADARARQQLVVTRANLPGPGAPSGGSPASAAGADRPDRRPAPEPAGAGSPPPNHGRKGLLLTVLGVLAALVIAAVWRGTTPDDQSGNGPSPTRVPTTNTQTSPAPAQEPEPGDPWQTAVASLGAYQDGLAAATWSEPIRGPGGQSAVALQYDGSTLIAHQYWEEGGWRQLWSEPVGSYADVSFTPVDTTGGGQPDLLIGATDDAGDRWGSVVFNDGAIANFVDGQQTVTSVQDLAWTDGALGSDYLVVVRWLDSGTALLWPRFPGTVAPGEVGRTVVTWQDILIRAGVISDEEPNRDGVYGEALVEVIWNLEQSWGWSNPDGEAVLGEAFYEQLLNTILSDG